MFERLVVMFIESSKLACAFFIPGVISYGSVRLIFNSRDKTLEESDREIDRDFE